MPKLLILGSASAVADEEHQNTHLAVVGRQRILMIDCPCTPILRLKQVGLQLDHLHDLILTHFHPDHVSGVPLMLMNLWLLGRKHPLNIYGLDNTLDRLRNALDLFEWSAWSGLFAVNFRPIPIREMALVLEDEEWRVFASPVRHLIPNIGLRIEFTGSRKTLVYSSDTEPCPEIIRLASEADVLLHEASGRHTGHSDAYQAGEIAQQANAKRLILIHYSWLDAASEALVLDAQRSYTGQVELARDLMEIDFH
jgi:ribonuclease Z